MNTTTKNDYPESDWRYEVANGDTKLGYAEWRNHQREIDAMNEAHDAAVKDLVTDTVQRASLVIAVYEAMLEETDTFDEVGRDLAYFMGETLKGDKFMAWLGVNDAFVRALHRSFDHTNAVWDSVDLMNDDVDDVFPARIKAAILSVDGGDVGNLDEADYPQAGAWADMLKEKG